MRKRKRIVPILFIILVLLLAALTVLTAGIAAGWFTAGSEPVTAENREEASREASPREEAAPTERDGPAWPEVSLTDGSPYGADAVCWMNGCGVCLLLKDGNEALSVSFSPLSETESTFAYTALLQTEQGPFELGTVLYVPGAVRSCDRWFWGEILWEKEESVVPVPVEPDLAGYCALFPGEYTETCYRIRSFDREKRLLIAEPVPDGETAEGTLPCEELTLSPEAVFTTFDDWSRDLLVQEERFCETLENEDPEEGLYYWDVCLFRLKEDGTVKSISEIFRP